MDNASEHSAKAATEADRLAYSINDFAEKSGIGRTTAYAEISVGRLRAKKLGSRTLIPADVARAFIASLPDVKAA